MILVVDNEGVLKNMAEIYLEAEGYELRHVQNGYQAQDVIMQAAAAVQLVVSVLHMNPGDGRELLKFVRNNFPMIPVVIFTPGELEESADDELLSSGAYGVINDAHGRAHEQLMGVVKSLSLRRASV